MTANETTGHMRRWRLAEAVCRSVRAVPLEHEDDEDTAEAYVVDPTAYLNWLEANQ